MCVLHDVGSDCSDFVLSIPVVQFVLECFGVAVVVAGNCLGRSDEHDSAFSKCVLCKTSECLFEFSRGAVCCSMVYQVKYNQFKNVFACNVNVTP